MIMKNQNKKIKPAVPDIGGTAPSFTVASFASISDKDKIVYNKNQRKKSISQRRSAAQNKRG
jgi:hypothetical protein